MDKYDQVMVKHLLETSFARILHLTFIIFIYINCLEEQIIIVNICLQKSVFKNV